MGLFFMYRRRRGDKGKDTTGDMYAVSQSGASAPTRVMNPLAGALPGGTGGPAAGARVVQLAEMPTVRVAMAPSAPRGASISGSSGLLSGIAGSSTPSSTGPTRRVSMAPITVDGVTSSPNPLAHALAAQTQPSPWDSRSLRIVNAIATTVPQTTYESTSGHTSGMDESPAAQAPDAAFDGGHYTAPAVASYPPTTSESSHV